MLLFLMLPSVLAGLVIYWFSAFLFHGVVDAYFYLGAAFLGAFSVAIMVSDLGAIAFLEVNEERGWFVDRYVSLSMTPVLWGVLLAVLNEKDLAKGGAALLGVFAGAGLMLLVSAQASEYQRGIFITLLSPIFIAKIFFKTLLIRFYSTLRYPLNGLVQLPNNWRETLFVIDIFHPSELLPQAGRVNDILTAAGVWKRMSTQFYMQKMQWILMLFVWHITALSYRLSLKASLWLWFPLAFALKPPFANRNSEDSRISMKRITRWNTCRLIIVALIMLWLLSTSPILQTINKLLPPAWHEISAHLPDAPKFGSIRYVLGWLICILTILLVISSINFNASHGEGLKSLDNIKPKNLPKFLSIAKNIERIRLALIAVIFLWGESMALGFAYARYPDDIKPFVLSWVLSNL
jgi:hypothetical protein